MTDLEPTDRVISQGRALVRAIEGLTEIDPTGPIERALALHEAAYGPDHPTVATDVNNLGSVLQDLGDLAGARAAFERALRILEEFLPPDHPHIKIVRKHLESLD